MTCPACGEASVKVIYLGLPMRLCTALDGCACVFGFWSWVPVALPIEGDGGFCFIQYEGSWWHGFKHWWDRE